MEFNKETQQNAKSFSEALSSIMGPITQQALEKAVPPKKLSSFTKEFDKERGNIFLK